MIAGVSALPLPSVVALALAYLPLAAVLSAVDLREHRLPNPLVLALSVAVGLVTTGTALLVPGARAACLSALGIALGAGVIAVLIALLAPDLLGMGDAKILPAVVAVAAVLGWDVLIGGMLGAAVLGGMAGIIALAVTRDARTRIAYGPVLLSAPLLGLVLAPAVRTALGL